MDTRRNKELMTFVQKLGLLETKSINWSLLDLALTHPSAVSENNYEQLEFVGDAVIRLATSELLLEIYPNAPVGEFAAIRSILVSDRVLAQFADNYGLERYLITSNSAAGDKAGRMTRLADAFEAVLGALYLSTHDLRLIRPWLDPDLKQKAEEIYQDPAHYNYKDALQEWTQAIYKILPKYEVQEIKNCSNPQERFSAEVWLEDKKLGMGTGRSKKSAQQAAAKQAYLSVKDVNN